MGNIISLPEAFEFYDPQSLRLFFLSSHYRSPLFYSEESVRSQERAMQRLRQAANAPSGDGPQLDAVPFRERFIEAMDDDLNTPRALASLFDLVREINRGRESGSNITTAQDILRELAGVLGLELDEPQVESAEAAPFIQTLVDVRAELRGARQFQLADSIRDRLTELGVTLEDNPEGTTWRLG